MTPELETSRLWLRPLAVEDAAQVQPLFPHWEIVRLLAKEIPWPYPEDGVREYYENVALPAAERGVEWHWTLRLKAEPGQIIGAISLIKKGVTNRGLWLGRAWQRQGLMSEACDVVTDFWFDILGETKLRVTKAAENAPSRRISEKQGMRLVEIIESDYVSGRLPTEVWEITAKEWRLRKSVLL